MISEEREQYIREQARKDADAIVNTHGPFIITGPSASGSFPIPVGTMVKLLNPPGIKRIMVDWMDIPRGDGKEWCYPHDNVRYATPTEIVTYTQGCFSAIYTERLKVEALIEAGNRMAMHVNRVESLSWAPGDDIRRTDLIRARLDYMDAISTYRSTNPPQPLDPNE